MTRFILVRHGQTQWNREARFCGQSDIPLDEVGLAQAEATGRMIAHGWQPDAIYCSPMVRARQTAEAIARQVGVPTQVHDGINDIHFGDLQGLTVEAAADHWPAVVKSWLDTPEVTRFPGGDGLNDLQVQAKLMLGELTSQHQDQTVVLVGHTVINRVILLLVLGLDHDRFWHLGQDTCAINVFDARDGDFFIESLNDTCHLHDPA